MDINWRSRMKFISRQPLSSYVIAIFIIVTITGGLLSQIVTNQIILAVVLFMQFFILLFLVVRFHRDYIKPLSKAVETVDEVLNQNYYARFQYAPVSELVIELGTKLNRLSKHLAEFSIQEQMQSEQLSTLIDHVQSGLVLIGKKGYVELVNRKFLTMFGNEQKDYVGYLYYHVLDHAIFEETVQNVFLYEKRVKETFSHYIGTEKYYYEVIGAPIMNEQNIVKGAVLVIYDITELKKLELMRKDFVANVSHDLKTPITSIKGFAETLLDGGIDDKETAREFLTIIHQEGNRMQELIEDLLVLSRLEQEDLILHYQKVNAVEFLQDVVLTLGQQAEWKKINLTVENDLDEIWFEADLPRVKQVVINLIHNAINYTQEGGDVTVAVTRKDDTIQLSVSDTGIGIDKESLPRIFERFYRVDKARSRYTGGTGLGLAIVKHIVEVHKGKIEIDSEINKGTTIHVYLPVSKDLV